MSKQQEKNKAVVRQLFAAIDAKDKERFLKAEHPDFSLAFTGIEKPLGREDHFAMALMHSQAYSDMKHQPEFQLAEGDYVVTKGTITGTNDGTYHGRPATHRKIWVPFVCICKMKEGRIVAIDSMFDQMAEQKQLYGQE
jgi:predicted ester cyclase